MICVNTNAKKVKAMANYVTCDICGTGYSSPILLKHHKDVTHEDIFEENFH